MKKTIILSLAIATLLLSGCAPTYNNDRIRPGDASYCGSDQSFLDMVESWKASDFPDSPNSVYDGKNEVEEMYLIKRAGLELYRWMVSATNFGSRGGDFDKRILNNMVVAARKLHEITPTRYADVIAKVKAKALCSDDRTRAYYYFWQGTDRYLYDESNRYYIQFLEN